MTIRIYGLGGMTYEVSDEVELGRVLSVHYKDDANEFLISHDGEKHPVIALSVAGELAALHYFPRERHPGYQSVGELQPGRELPRFYFGGELAEAYKPSIVPFAVAVAVVKEFLSSNELPKGVKWMAL
jgi:hypothetical protein